MPPTKGKYEVCPICGKDFWLIPSRARKGRGKYCSKECMGRAESLYRKGEHGANWGGGPEKKKCKLCGASYEVVKSQALKSKYCSRACKDNDRSASFTGRKVSVKVSIPCEVCGQQITLYPSQANRRRYCSVRCMAIGYEERTGEKSNTWRGGLTAESAKARASKEYTEWREAVFARDNWKCQDCRVGGGELHAHHVFSFADFPEHRFDLWNGVTLCVECHAKIHPILRRVPVEKDY